MIFAALVVTLLAVLLGIFFSNDADLPLILLPKPPAKAHEGKVVWIVGASSGIGAYLAEDFCREGAHVILSSRRLNQLQEVADKCAKAGPFPALVLPLDVTKYEEHQTAFNHVMEVYGRIDVLVLNAGISQRNLADDTPFSVTEDIMKLNFFSLVALNKIVLPTLLKQKSGKIVVMSSLSGIIGTPIASSYSASKFALHGYFNALRAEVAMDNVKVSIICPGPVESEISSKAHRNPALPRQDEGKKMATERCTGLIMKGLYYDIDEMWISEHPFLAMTYVTAYFPFLSRQLMVKFFGPARINALKSGLNIYDAKVALGLNK